MCSTFLYSNCNLQETNGLVREGRDLKHFDLSPVPGCNKTVVKLGKVNGKPVCIIKVSQGRLGDLSTEGQVPC